MKYDVFISHSSADQELSEKICDYLQQQGIKCWLDSRNVTGHYARSIIEGIEQSEMMVLIYSEKANNSAHVENEIDNAFCMGKMIIPFRVEGTPYSTVLRYYLNKSHYVDGMPEPLEALEQLRDQIKRNMSEQERNAKIEEALIVVAEWAEIDVDILRAVLKQIKEKFNIQLQNEHIAQEFSDNEIKSPNENLTPVQEASTDEFEQMLNEFIEREFSGEGNESGQKEKIEVSSLKESKSGASVQDNDDSEEPSSRRYDLLQNAAGEIMLIIHAHDGEPENPRLVYDGGDSALLYRSRESAIMLEGIAAKARSTFLNIDQVLVVEVKDDDVAREYMVPMRKIKALKHTF